MTADWMVGARDDGLELDPTAVPGVVPFHGRGRPVWSALGGPRPRGERRPQPSAARVTGTPPENVADTQLPTAGGWLYEDQVCSPTCPTDCWCGGTPPSEPKSTLATRTAPETAYVVIDASHWSGCELALFENAWAVLVENLDLIRWVACTSGLSSEDYDCIEAILLGQHPTKSPMQVAAMDCATKSTRMKAGVNKDTLWICMHGEGMGSTFFEDGAYFYCMGTQLDAECVVLGVAIIMLHEFMHSCGYDADHVEFDNLPPGCYQPTSQVTGLFQDTLWDRYPLAWRSPCCINLPTRFDSHCNAPPDQEGHHWPHFVPDLPTIEPVDLVRDEWTPGGSGVILDGVGV